MIYTIFEILLINFLNALHGIITFIYKYSDILFNSNYKTKIKHLKIQSLTILNNMKNKTYLKCRFRFCTRRPQVGHFLAAFLPDLKL